MTINQRYKKPALILGGDLAGLWMARILGRRGIDVYVVTSEKEDIALSSKYCKKKCLATAPFDCHALRKILRGVAQSTSKRLVVYPASDDLALNLSKIKEELPDDFDFVVGEREAVETLINKRRFYELLSRNKIPYPKTYFPNNLAEVNRLADKISYPIFVKPSMIHLFNKAFGYEIKGFVANSRDELRNYYRWAASLKVDVLFQHIISGPPNAFYQLEGLYNREYLPSVLFARQAKRIWPLNFGTTTLCSSISLSNLSEESREINKLIQRIKYNGIISADFKRDPLDGRLKLLEINARLWLHFWLPTECGVDIIFASYLDAIGEKLDVSNKYTTGVKSLSFLPDLKSSIGMIRLRELSFSEYISSLLGKNVYAYFNRRDMLPFFRFYSEWIFKHFKLFKQQQKP